MELKSFDTMEEMIADLQAENSASSAEFNKYLCGSWNIDLETIRQPVLSVKLNQNQRDQYGIFVKQIKLFNRIDLLADETEHDFVVQLFFIDGTNAVFLLDFTYTCSIDYTGKEHHPAELTKMLTSLLLHAAEGTLPGFQVWNSLVKFDLAEHLSPEEQSKLHWILD